MVRTHRDITHDLRRSVRRKTVSLYIERDGKVTVIGPEFVTRCPSPDEQEWFHQNGRS